MDILTIIRKKRDKLILSENEINFFIEGYTKTKQITDYQAAALIMAIYLNGLNDSETFYLTKAMLNSGKTIDFPGVNGTIIDKHSTGGVGDKVSLILLPICVACGLKIAKLSGKGLGHTGGTIDKLESIGINTNLKGNQYLDVLKKTGMFIMGQTADVVPADKLLYDLRNATETVNSIPLIAASIVSKKLALKANWIFLDVKVGAGAFCTTLKKANELASLMLRLFKKFKRKALIHITDMDQPLGTTIGNAIEMQSAIDFLKGKPENQQIQDMIEEFCVDILLTTTIAKNKNEALNKIRQSISSGKAFKVFEKWAITQGSSKKILGSQFFLPKYSLSIKSKNSGYIKYKSAKEIGMISFYLGAGRLRKTDPIDYQAGILLKKTKNDYVKKGEELAVLYSSKPINKKLVNDFLNNIIYSNKKFIKSPSIIKAIK